MTIHIRIRRPQFPRFGHQLTALSLAGGPSLGNSFQATLSSCTETWVPTQEPSRTEELPAQVDTKPAAQSGPNAVARAWSWLHGKYALTSTKRLRVAETVSLGEKRFVALVCVEGREFLVGGGASGVSLLAQLSPAPGPVDGFQPDLDEEGDSE
jgi:Flagellar biosynthesis protein, FliO